MSKFTSLIIPCIIFLLPGIVYSQAIDDPQLLEWAQLYNEGELDKLGTDLVREVHNTGNNSYYAGFVWCLVFNNDDGIRASVPALDRSCRIREYRDTGDVQGLLESFPTDEVINWKNYWDVRNYNWALTDGEAARTRDQLLLDLLAGGTDDFNVAWNLETSANQSDAFRQKLLDILEDENCCNPQLRKFLIESSRYSDSGTHQSLEAFITIFGEETTDYEHSRFLAPRYTIVYDYESSARHRLDVAAVNPYGNALQLAAESVYKTGDTEKAVYLVKQRARGSSVATGEPLEDLTIRYKSELYRNVGEWVKAREIVQERLSSGSEYPPLFHELARIESESKRYAEAADAARNAFEHDRNAAHLTSWLEAMLDNGDAADVWDLFNRYGNDKSLITQRIYWIAGTALDRLEAQDVALELYQEAVDYFPESGWMRRMLGNMYRLNGNPARAISELEEAVELRSDNVWAFYRLSDAYGEYYRGDASSKYKEDVVHRYRALQNAWMGYVQLRPFDAIQIYEEARVLNPSEYWPVERIRAELNQVNAKFNVIYSLFDEAMDNMSSWHADALLEYYNDFTNVIINHGQSQFLDREQLEFALALNEAFKEYGGAADRYHYNRFRLMQSAGLSREAAGELLKAIDHNPDNTTYIYSLYLDDIASVVGSVRFIRYHNYVQRNPWDADRVVGLAHRHLRWGGSALVALGYYEHLAKIAPDKLRLDEYNSALLSIGNRTASYKHTYFNNMWGPSRSDRYIGWYHNTRLRAQQQSLDYKLNANGSVDVFHPNGITATYKDHPITGKPLYIRYGAAYVRVDYDEKGNLISIEASSGTAVEFEYDEHSNIIRFEMREAGAETEIWYFGYDDNNQIIRVTDNATHEMLIMRDNYGEIIDVESSDGLETSMTVNRVFQRLTRMTSLLENQRYGDIPQLPYRDETLDALSVVWYDSYGEDKAPAGLAYAEYLIENLTSHQDNASDAEAVLIYMTDDTNVIMNDEQRVQLLSLWYKYLKITRPIGVDQNLWHYWQQQLAWFEQQSFRRQLAREADALKAKIESDPIALLPAARWIPESAYMNPAFWKTHPVSELGNQYGVSIQLNTVLERENGDLLAGTSHGLALNRRGYWELLVFDDVRGFFSANINPSRTGNASSHINALAETAAGELWIGTRNGLILLEDEYTDRPARWRTAGDGLPHPDIQSFVLYGTNLYAGTPNGLVVIDVHSKSLESSSGKGIVELNETIIREGPAATVVTPDGIYYLEDDQLRKIHDSQTVRSAIITPDGNQLLFLEGNILYRKPIDGSLSEKYPVAGQQDIVKTTNIQKLRYLPVPNESELAVAVLTDQGITAYHQSNFEFLALPDQHTDRRVQVNNIIIGSSSLFFGLHDTVLEFSQIEQTVVPGVSPADMLYAPAWGYTFMAAGNVLLYSDEDDLYPSVFDYISSNSLELTSNGGLLTTDNSEVVYYAPGTVYRQQLFTSDRLAFLEGRPGINTPERFNSLLFATDGSIWATTPTTVFRLVLSRPLESDNEEDLEGELFVYSMYKNQEEFPVNSDMISRVIETKDGDIWVIASDEGHRRYQGVALTGGLFRFTGDGFESLKDEMGLNWFITSYTKIDDETALAGTTRGFALHQGSRYHQLWSLEDPSYMELRSEMPMLWLGTRGAKFGEDTFLFGTAGGVVIFNNGEWFYPQNLNRLLPEDIRYGERGGRHIHSITANGNGVIYVSTDRGLLIYDLGDNDDVLLFQENGMPEQALRHRQRRQLIMESDVLMDALRKNPELRDLITELDREQRAIEQLEEKLHGNDKLGKSQTQKDEISETRPENLGRQLNERRRNYETISRLLEMEHHGAFQMLQLNPLDVAQLRHQLGEDEHIVVYIPTEKKLTIQLIDQDEILLIDVNMGATELKHLTMLVSDNLAGRDFSARRSFGEIAIVQADPSITDVELTDHLSTLYEALLRPVEAFVGQDALLYVVPAGPLNYLPFNALVRGTTPKKEFAVERFTMGVLPSMYLLDLVLRHQPSTSRNAMIIGDPDGSLPGARREAEDIHRMLRPSSPLLLGNAADRSAILQYASDARIVHFATHGKLNPDEPARSYLLLAGNQQLSVADVMQLPLRNTDLVVLSACETGLGTSGLEYATLARAFAHAGAPSVLATLWEVPDESSKILVTQFYQNLNSGMNVFRAMSEAQRAFLKEHQRYQSPVNWAGYVPFGKP